MRKKRNKKQRNEQPHHPFDVHAFQKYCVACYFVPKRKFNTNSQLDLQFRHIYAHLI